MSLKQNAEILSKDKFGDKVLRLENDSILKLFRIKHIFSSARIVPYSIRFSNNADKLSNLGIPTVKIIDVFKWLFLNKITDEQTQKSAIFVVSLGVSALLAIAINAIGGFNQPISVIILSALTGYTVSQGSFRAIKKISGEK